ncbi:hypothetical protein GF385_00260, partial [Candidatus Dependentiae bacterium]|nr:hypothetical protein [Candidatus Dependentiae bacterium]
MNLKKLYIEIENSNLFIAKLIESQNNFYLFDIKNIKLEKLDFFDNVFFNISSIFLNIKKYLKQNKIDKAETIVCLPDINKIKKNNLYKNLIILQSTLLISKTELKIKKIISSKILKKGINMPYKFFFNKKEVSDQLNFFKQFHPPKKTSPKNWLFLTIFLSISYTLFFMKIQNTKNKELKKLKNQNALLAKKTNLTSKQIKKLQELKALNSKLEKKLEKYKVKNNNPKDILIHISKVIPNNCKLTKINLYSKKSSNPIKAKKKIIVLEGITKLQEEINKFSKKLSAHN